MNHFTAEKRETKFKDLNPGTVVRVRNAKEIFTTLDEDGAIDGMPFMPEMLRFCGLIFHVSTKITQTCTEVGKVRKLSDSVFLDDLRCDGSAHENCARCCKLFWKTAWLEETYEPFQDTSLDEFPDNFTNLRIKNSGDKYLCQSTELYNATKSLTPWNLERWYQGLLHRELTLVTFIRFFILPILAKIVSRLIGKDINQLVGKHLKTPEEALHLQSGENVRIKSKEQIIKTLDNSGKNRGLSFTPEMISLIGRQFAVKQRVEPIIDESTGQLRKLKNTVLLEESVCDGRSICGGCGRSSYHLWREIWLERIETRN